MKCVVCGEEMDSEVETGDYTCYTCDIFYYSDTDTWLRWPQ